MLIATTITFFVPDDHHALVFLGGVVVVTLLLLHAAFKEFRPLKISEAQKSRSVAESQSEEAIQTLGEASSMLDKLPKEQHRECLKALGQLYCTKYGRTISEFDPG